MPKKLRYVLPLCLTLAIPAVSLAQMEQAMPQQRESASVGSMPSRGMTMDQVIQYFGQPIRRYEPVGKPPISRWQYDGMLVYFENEYVIHSVAIDDNGK